MATIPNLGNGIRVGSDATEVFCVVLCSKYPGYSRLMPTADMSREHNLCCTSFWGGPAAKLVLWRFCSLLAFLLLSMRITSRFTCTLNTPVSFGTSRSSSLWSKWEIHFLYHMKASPKAVLCSRGIVHFMWCDFRFVNFTNLSYIHHAHYLQIYFKS